MMRTRREVRPKPGVAEVVAGAEAVAGASLGKFLLVYTYTPWAYLPSHVASSLTFTRSQQSACKELRKG